MKLGLDARDADSCRGHPRARTRYDRLVQHDAGDPPARLANAQVHIDDFG
jgi:hypothetical protein